PPSRFWTMSPKEIDPDAVSGPRVVVVLSPVNQRKGVSSYTHFSEVTHRRGSSAWAVDVAGAFPAGSCADAVDGAFPARSCAIAGAMEAHCSIPASRRSVTVFRTGLAPFILTSRLLFRDQCSVVPSPMG